MDFGAFDLIGKPFDIVELRQKVKNALEKAAQKGRL
jgi:DNA-binding response OmpR family regulator